MTNPLKIDPQPDTASAPIACSLCAHSDALTLCAHHARLLADHLPLLRRRLDATFAEMRRDGQVLTLGQEQTLARGLGLP